MKRAASARSAKKPTRVTTKVVKTLRPGPTKFVGLPRRNPSAVSSRTRSRTGPLGLGAGPTRYTNRRMQIIEEDEYIGEILGTGGFYTTPYSCNPGQSQTFPWGSRIFSLYEEYEFTSLEFYYKREVSEFATNGQTGKVMLSFDYDASDPAPTTKLQVEDSRTHVDFMPCTPQASLRIDTRLIKEGVAKYVRPGAVPSGGDVKTFDAGVLYVSTYGCQTTAVVGELHVRYRCIAKEPVLSSPSALNGAIHFTTSPLSGLPFSSPVLMTGGSPNMVAGVVLTPTAFTMTGTLAGNYLVVMSCSSAGATTSWGGGPTLSGAGSAFMSIFSSTAGRDQSATLLSLGTTGTPYDSLLVIAITVGAAGCILTPSLATVGATAYGDLFIVQLPPTLLTGMMKMSLTERLALMEAFLAHDGRQREFLSHGSSSQFRARDPCRPLFLDEECYPASSIPPRILDESKEDVEDIEDLHLSEAIMRLAKRKGFKDLPPSGLSSPGVIVQSEPSLAPSSLARSK
jgi:hypothetical protein